MVDSATSRWTAVLQPSTARKVITWSCCYRRGQGSHVLRRASTWSAAAVVLLLPLLVASSLTVAEAAGLWGVGSQRAGRGAPLQTDGQDDGDIDNVFAKFQQEQFWAEVNHAGMEVLEEEVAEKKTKEIFAQVAKACSIGAQMTLIMGGGGLLFRILPVLLGHDLDDEDEDEANSPFLLQIDNHPQQEALQADAGGRRQPLLASGREEPNEDATVRLEREGAGGSGTAAAAACVVLDGDEGGGVVVVNAGARGTAIGATGDRAGEEEEEAEDGDVVVNTPVRVALRKVRRLSRPFLKAMAPPLALLLVVRLALGTVLAKRIDPTLELLFGDDILDLYSVNKKVINKVDMPFPKDADDVPGRKKTKAKGVQRLPRPEAEGNDEDGGEAEKGT